MSTLASDPLVGHLVDGRYEIVRRIARGGMATVYLATDRRLDRRVALKVMHAHLAEGTDVVSRFRREARAAARLAHSGIVGVLDQGIDGETSYLVMEYVPGRTLRSELAGHGALSLGRSLELTEAVLDALAAAHRAGVVHRDVKPENVLLRTDGAVKVADFGLARAVTEATAASTGTLLGTVAYLSPEVVTSGAADARTDVYATGIMLSEMLTGAPPFTGASPIQVAYRHVHEDVPPPSDVVPWLPLEVDDLVAALTARDPAQRPTDAGQALTLLRRARREMDDRALSLRANVAGRPSLLVDDVDDSASLLAASDDAPREVGPTLGQETTSLDREPGTGTIAIPIGAVAAPQPPVATPTPARRPRRRRRAWTITLVLALLAGLGFGAWYVTLGPAGPVTVPPLAGTSADDAEAELTDLNLAVGREDRYSDDVAAGDVISSDPEAGRRLARGETVTLAVSLGVEHLDVPVLVGEPQADAVAALDAVGLPVGAVDTEYNRTIAAGVVISASHEEGDSVPHTTTIDLVVSDGPEPVTIPSYVGTNADQAAEQLAAQLDIDRDGVGIGIVERYSDDVDAGNVIQQSLMGPAYQGDGIELTVSLGPELFAVPDVERRSLSDATRILEEAGFTVDARASWGGIIGQVVDQEPAAGTMVRGGTLITLTYV